MGKFRDHHRCQTAIPTHCLQEAPARELAVARRRMKEIKDAQTQRRLNPLRLNALMGNWGILRDILSLP